MSESGLLQYVLLNGTFFKNKEKLFTAGIFEKFLFKEQIRSAHCHLLFWEEQIEQINRQLKLFHIKESSVTQKKSKDIKRQIERILTKNKLFKEALVTVYFFKNGTDAEYLIKTETLNIENEFNSEKGAFLSFNPYNIKNISAFSSFASGSEIFWEFAVMNTHSPFEPLLQNQEGIILEVPGKNLFIIKKNKVYTPNIAAGAFRSPAFPLVRAICTELEMDFIQDQKISCNDMTDAEEIFLVSHIYGIMRVTGFENKRYFLNKTRQIAHLFQEKILSFT